MSIDPYVAAREINSTIVMHSEFERVLEGADGHIEMSARTGVPISLIVTAAPGMGKSALIELIAKRVRQRFATLSNDDPLVWLEFGTMVDPHKLASEFLEALGYPMAPARASLEAITKMIDVALERIKPQIGLIDEAQHVCEGCRDITARAVTDWLKLRMDRHSLGFILAGTNVLTRLRDINPQFASRAPTDFVINAFGYGPAWLQLLNGFVPSVKAVNLGILSDRKVAKPIHEGTTGNLRRLKQWLGCATYHTLVRSSTELSTGDLRNGYLKAFGPTAHISNPFEAHQ